MPLCGVLVEVSSSTEEPIVSPIWLLAEVFFCLCTKCTSPRWSMPNPGPWFEYVFFNSRHPSMSLIPHAQTMTNRQASPYSSIYPRSLFSGYS